MVNRKSIPYEFVLELLTKAQPYTRPMFGCTSVYVGEKIVFVLRHREDHPDDNGVWVATIPEHHLSLRAEFPSLRSIRLFGGGETGWQNLPEEAADFEESVTELCEHVLAGDPRIGKVPKRKGASGPKKRQRPGAKRKRRQPARGKKARDF